MKPVKIGLPGYDHCCPSFNWHVIKGDSLRRLTAVAVSAVVLFGVSAGPAMAAAATPTAQPTTRGMSEFTSCLMGAFSEPMNLLTNLPGCFSKLT